MPTFQRSSNLCIDLLVSLLKLLTGCPGGFIVDIILNLAHVDRRGKLIEDELRKACCQASVFLLFQNRGAIMAKRVVSTAQTVAQLCLLSQQVVLSSTNDK